MDKRQLAQQILDTGGSLFVTLDPKQSEVPQHLKGQYSVKLEYGYNLPIPIPNLVVREEGIHGTLRFSGRDFRCFVPWSAVYAMNDAAYKLGYVWSVQKKPHLRLVAKDGKLV